jgi:RNase H-fold protein (predicted Holliday junction resolvase)
MLAFDVSEQRIGVAIGGAEGSIAAPFSVL